jgi:hypothetical protein
MKTILDEFYERFIHLVSYTNCELRIVVAEGFRAEKPEDRTILGHVINGLYAIDTSDRSRLVEVRFYRPIAWHLVDEAFTSWDEYEVREDKFSLQILTKSRYLDFIQSHHGWFKEMRGPGAHYRLLTANEIVDVIACDPPEVSQIENK